MYPGGSLLRRFAEKLAEKTGARKSAGFPWSKGIPDRNFPKPLTGGSGCLAPAILIILVPLVLLAIALF
jgi:hypothetical protein